MHVEMKHCSDNVALRKLDPVDSVLKDLLCERFVQQDLLLIFNKAIKQNALFMFPYFLKTLHPKRLRLQPRSKLRLEEKDSFARLVIAVSELFDK